MDQSKNVYQFCNGDLNKFVLLLREGVYPCEYTVAGKDLMKHHYQIKRLFHSKPNEEGISNIDYAHSQKVWKEVHIKNLGEYHDLYIQSDTLLLADLFENFRNKCMEIYELDPAHFVSAPGLAWQACLKMTGVKLELLTDSDMLLIVEKGIKGGKCDVIHGYVKAYNKK